MKSGWLNWAKASQDLRIRSSRTLIENTLACDPDLTVSEVPQGYNDRLTFLVEHGDGSAWCVSIEPVDTRDD